jgi:protein tyrosine/serine phosphatase
MSAKIERRTFLSLMLSAAAAPAVAGTAETDWVTLTSPQLLPNLHRVTDRLYRSAQPVDAEAFRILAANGIRSVVNLRQTMDDAPLAAGTGLTLCRVPMRARSIGEDDGHLMALALRAIEDGLARGSVLVHCQHGADRTGAVIAMTRVLWQGWSPDKAVDEMLDGYHFSQIWWNIPQYIRTTDPDDLRRKIAAVDPADCHCLVVP